MSDHDEQRRAMRRELRERRSALSPEEQAGVSAAVERRLAQIAALKRSPVVGGYRAIRGEVDIDAALTSLHAGGTLVTVPRVSGDRMDFLPWTSGSETITGSFGIDEPINGEPVQFSQHDVVLVPLVAFDGTGQRLGQGGGFYDRAIAAAGAGPPAVDRRRACLSAGQVGPRRGMGHATRCRRHGGTRSRVPGRVPFLRA